MARSAAVIEAQIDLLLEHIGSGELRVTYDGKTVEYRSLEDMQGALSALKHELAEANGGARRKIHFTDAPRLKGWA